MEWLARLHGEQILSEGKVLTGEACPMRAFLSSSELWGAITRDIDVEKSKVSDAKSDAGQLRGTFLSLIFDGNFHHALIRG